MNIIMLSVRDCCGSGYKLSEAINENTDHTVKTYVFKRGFFGHRTGATVRFDNRDRIQHEIDECDIVHIKGDQPWTVYPGLKHYPQLTINHKPIILTLSSTLTRSIEHGGQGQCSRGTYPHAKLITAFSPDLMHDWVDVLTYFPIRRAETTWTRKEIPVLQHIPSNRDTKGTELVIDIVNKLKTKVEFELLEKLTHRQTLEAKKRATLYFDQFVCGAYGNSAVESMNYGIPVANWMCERSLKHMNPPVIHTNGNADRWAFLIDWVLERDMSELSRITKEYCGRFHSYESVAKQWDEIYRSL